MKLYSIIITFAVSMLFSILHAQTNFVCIGNSISHGKTSKGLYHNTSIGDSLGEMSYRFWLWEKLDSAEYSIDFVGYYDDYLSESDSIISHSRYTGETFPPYHESYYGIQTNKFLEGGWADIPDFETRVATYMPNVALIHLGTNGADSLVDQKEIDLKEIIQLLRGRNKNITVLLAKLITNWKPISQRMPNIAKEMTLDTSIVYLVDMATGFVNDPGKENTMTYDWVHPNYRGQIFMAKRWFDAFTYINQQDITPPALPTELTINEVLPSSLKLSWNSASDNVGVNVYKIYLNGQEVAQTAFDTITLKGINLGNIPDIEVTAIDYQQNESPYIDVSFLVSNNASVLDTVPVFFNTETDTTGVDGLASNFSRVTKGSYDYSINIHGYRSVNENIYLTKDTVVQVLLEETNLPPTMNMLANQTRLLEDGDTTISLSGIDDGNITLEQNITMSAYSSDTSVARVMLNYTPNDSIGSIDISLADTGTTTILIALKDDGGREFGGNDSVSYSFTYQVVLEYNEKPTIDPIADQEIFEDALLQTITIQGLNDGDAGIEQELTLSASSSDTLVIPNPTILYSNGDTNAQLTYQPNANMNGIVSIEIEVSDNGGSSVNNGNQSIIISFLVNVMPINDAPLVDPVNDTTITNFINESTILLSGIGDGDDGVEQNITVSSNSSNENIVITNVEYNSPDSTAELFLQYPKKQNGSAIITVTVIDDGGIENGGINQIAINFSVTLDLDNNIEKTKSSLVKIYPAPALDVVNMLIDDNRFISQIKVIDLKGKCVLFSNKINTNKFALPVTALSSGVYLLEITIDNKEIIKKTFIKK